MSLIVNLIAAIQRCIFLCIGSFYAGPVLIWLAFRFICNPLGFFRAKYRSAPPACLRDPRYGVHKKTKINGRFMHYVETGNPQKPLVVLIHGFPENWWSWRHQLLALAGDYHVVAPSLPGYCESDGLQSPEDCRIDHLADDIRAIIEHLGHKQAFVVGHDWGAGIAWEVARLYPSIVRRLVVLDCPVRPAYLKSLGGKQFFYSWYFFMHQLPFLGELFWYANDMEMLDIMMAKKPLGIGNRELLSQEDMECYKYYFSKSTLHDPLTYYRTSLSFRSMVQAIESRRRGEKVRIKPKTLILWGSEDCFLVSKLAYESAQYCEDARVQVFEGASHWLQQHEPEGVTRAIQQFLNEV